MISVCLASYNGASYIREQLVSILMQLGAEDEVIISDDCSQDTTCNIVREINDGRIKLYQQTKNIGPIKNFEFTLQKASGDYIFLSDQDDVWNEKKVNTIIPLLKEYHLVCHNASINNDSTLNKSTHNLFEKYHTKSGVLKNLIQNSYTGCCMVFRRDTLKVSLPFPKYIPMHDQWIGLITNSLYKVLFLDKNLIQYRRHNNNATHWKKKTVLTLPDMFVKRLYLGVVLLKRYLSFLAKNF